MFVTIIDVNENGSVTINYSDGTSVNTYLDSRCVNNLNQEQYNALVIFKEVEIESYFNILDEIKSKI